MSKPPGSGPAGNDPSPLARAEQLALVQGSLGIVTWIWDVDGEQAQWYGDLSPLLGLPPGGHSNDLPGFIAHLHPDDAAASRPRFMACLKGQLPSYRVEERVVWPDGSVHWLETLGRGSYDRNGRAQRLVGVITDITERKQAEQALLATETRFRRLIEAAPVAIGISRGDRPAYGNPSFLRLFGFHSIEALAGLRVADLIAPRARDEFSARSQRRLSGEDVETSYETLAQRADGSEFNCLVSVTDLVLDGGDATLVFLQDVSERARAEAELQRLNAGLEQRVAERTRDLEAINMALADARDAAEAASRAKADFLANMSHEIRTPMNAVLGMTDLALREAVLSPKARSYLSKTRHAAESLLGIINDILDFSKIEAGKLELEAEEFALDDVIERITTLVGPTATAKGLDLLVSTAPEVPRRLVGDPLRLGQVLLNLCSNAAKFTEQGEIVVAVSLDDGAPASLPMLRFAVRDSGVGMDAEQLGRLFRPFGQLDASTTRRFGGTGLGLAICKQLVDMMGGGIGVRSALGQGSEFHFTLPCVPAAEPSREAPAQPFVGLRVLVVDDSATACEVLTGLLVSLGCHVDSVASAAAALLALQTAPREAAYQVVLLDWKMPGEDGMAAARRIRSSAGLALQPQLILVTAYGDEVVAQRALAEGFEGYLAKPVGGAALTATLGTVRGVPTYDGVESESAIEVIELLNGRRILLVEDNELNQIVATDLLSGVAGAIVDVAANGREAIARAGAQRYDVVLMDVQMPEMDGYAATAALRRDPAHAMLPVIAMTAHAMARDRELCLAAGMNDFVSKPFEPRDLFAVIARWLPQSAAQRAVAAADKGSGTGEAGGILFERGLHRCLGRHDLHARVLRRYFETRADDALQLREAIERGDRVHAGSIAHTVVSAAGTIGAEALSAIARDLQQALAAAESPHTQPLLVAFEAQHRLVMQQLQTYLGGNPA